MAPVLRFALIGGALFVLAQGLAPAPGGRIELTPALLEGLEQDHLRRRGRPPTEAERRALIDRWAEQEALYREALALGLDRGDVIVRRRLVQKMQFVLEAEAEPGDPTDAQLASFYSAHRDRYARPPRVDLSQVFLDRGRRGSTTVADAAALRARLQAGTAPETLGDPHLHGAVLAGRGADELTAIFGAAGAAAVLALPAGEWSPPLESPHGLHLVRIDSRRPGYLPPLAEVRAAVAADWRTAERDRLAAAAIERLRARYAVDAAPVVDAATAALPER